ncbi:MAG: iron-containing redox enzyme family protein [Thaumarchaeota archaeon]|nr:iron-containing redox enzyme family protein [Nitrososphaerota archaeon]
MNGLVSTIDAEIEKRSLLKHPFYKSWSAGALTVDDLAVYSAEYFQMVKTVPELVKNANAFPMDASTREAVSGIGAEESVHVELWTRFASALGVTKTDLASHKGHTRTNQVLSQLQRASKQSLAQVAAVMYAIESEQPKISRTKLDGLQRFYGMDGKGDSTTYFREHEEADVRHAAVWRNVLEHLGENERREALQAAIESLDAQNAILDSVMGDCSCSENA